jgi:hypothetical protein
MRKTPGAQPPKKDLTFDTVSQVRKHLGVVFNVPETCSQDRQEHGNQPCSAPKAHRNFA